MQTYLFIGGLLFGFFSSTMAGIVDSQLLSKRQPADAEFSLGGPLLILIGILNSIIGLISMIISWLVTGSLRSALFLGASVLVGFVLGFLLLASVLIFREK
jgi:hypothetical protein